MSVHSRSSQGPPEPAKVEEYDDAQDAVKAGTAVHAHADRAREAAAPPPSALPSSKSSERRPRHNTDRTSDSGYHSSRTSARAVAAPDRNASTPAAAGSPRKPVILRHDSAQGKSSDRRACKGPCDHPECRSMRNPERRYTLSRDQQPPPAPNPHQHPPPQPPAPHIQQSPYYQPPPQPRPPPQQQQQPPYTYAYPSQMPPAPTPQPVPMLAARPRMRSLSNAGQPRPSSYHAGVTMHPSYGSQYGPPPSSSAYQHATASYYQQPHHHPQQTSGYLASTPPTQSMMTYPMQSPITPTSPALGHGPLPLVSARAPIDPNLPGLGHRQALPPGPMVRRPSARQQSTFHALPGRYPDDESTEESVYSDSESDYTSSEDDVDHDDGDFLVNSTRRLSLSRRERDRRAREDRERMPPPQVVRRPSASKRHSTAPAVVPRIINYGEPIRQRHERAHHSAADLGMSPPDRVDSDRTAHAVLAGRPGRTNSTYSGQSRRQSLSTSATASSDQTPATSYSSGSGSRRIIEDRHGRQREYLSRDGKIRYDRLQKELLKNRIEEDRARDRLYKQRDTTAKVEEYQRKAAAGVVADNYEELSAEKINQVTANDRQHRRTSGSHISHHSRKSSSSTKTGAVKISSGGTEIHVYGDANVSVEATDDGSGPRLIIGNRETAYHGSSRDSKQGRSRGGSEIRARPIREEDGYETAY
nr:hypothetical protein CFP56_31798 [Quercus suber]